MCSLATCAHHHSSTLRFFMLQSHVILEILCKAGPADDVHGVWSFVQALGYIDDVAWSRDYAKQKWRYSRWAARRISKELRQRGVDVDTCLLYTSDAADE